MLMLSTQVLALFKSTTFFNSSLFQFLAAFCSFQHSVVEAFTSYTNQELEPITFPSAFEREIFRAATVREQ